ncbi:hypothetical protein [Sulfurimonas sp.]|uniref:hypothetical protein n=1 Tax=Sulfurimonas sp. TaxID=2022749 RepID=UPI00356860BB
MKTLLRFFLVLIIISSTSYALDFKQTIIIKLKKDEQKKFLVKYENFVKLFDFRWTLYKNGGLVIHRSYDKMVAQNILYKRYKNNSFRLDLKSRGESQKFSTPYILVKFEEFDYKTDEAVLKMFLYDNVGKVSLEEIKERG